MKYETASLSVALNNDSDNTVPKDGVTASECAMLQTIHGIDAVHAIVLTGTVERAPREERERLATTYGAARDNQGNSLFGKVFPGAASRMFERFEELDLRPEQFKTPPARIVEAHDNDFTPAIASAAPVMQPGDDLDELEADDPIDGTDDHQTPPEAPAPMDAAPPAKPARAPRAPRAPKVAPEAAGDALS